MVVRARLTAVGTPFQGGYAIRAAAGNAKPTVLNVRVDSLGGPRAPRRVVTSTCASSRAGSPWRRARRSHTPLRGGGGRALRPGGPHEHGAELVALRGGGRSRRVGSARGRRRAPRR